LLALALLAPPPAHAQRQVSFVLRVDRQQVPLDDSFICEATLSFDGDRVDGYRAPDFKGFRVLAEHPSQSTQIQMGGGGMFRQTIYTWRYELQPLRPGAFTLGPARARADGHEVRSDTASVIVGPPLGQRRPPPPAATQPPRRRLFPGFGFDLFDDEPPASPAPPASDGGESFVRVAADKRKVYVGEPVAVEWQLFLTERQDKYQTVTEPRTDGFWSEELPLPGQPGSLNLTQQPWNGRTYLVAPLMRKALFPLQAGKLSVTPLESEISQVDFFGRVLRTQRLKAEPLEIEAAPLPTEGRPAGFDASSVGSFRLEARLDRDRVGVGEAVTLTLAVTGRGNLRKLAPPRLPALAGVKTYEPKVDVKIDRGDGISGSKTVEHLLLPERAGTIMIPAFELAVFDPEARAYRVERSLPLRLEVAADGRPAAAGAGAAAGAVAAGGASALATAAGAENVLPVEIRPPRNRPTLRRDIGTTFYRSRLFWGVVLLPPLAFAATVAAGRVRERLSQETERGRRRKLRRLVKRRLRAAEAHLEAGAASPLFIEIDRVLRELVEAKLGRSIAGLAHDEIGGALGASGLDADTRGRVLGLLEDCDRGRFAPGSVGRDEMRAALERAEEIIFQIEKARLRLEEAA
jgi:hypothetical protein